VIWSLAIPFFALLVFAILLALWILWRRIPRIGNVRETEAIDRIREEMRGKPFDHVTTIQKAWGR
jgi:hypothetical protein